MLLNVQELCVSYLTKKTELKAVDHVSFGIERGDTLGIIGESGSGKSTIVMAMLRQLDPRFSKITGRVEFDGQELLTLPDAEFKKLLWKLSAIWNYGGRLRPKWRWRRCCACCPRLRC